MGFEALASLGFANTLGSAEVSLDAIIENCRTIATALPVNADLENCGADEPEAAARATGLAAEAGAVGGSIEDSTGDPHARSTISRVQAAVEAARALPFPFTLTGAGREPAAWPGRSRRHRPPPAGIRGCRRRRAVFSRRARSRHHPNGGRSAPKTVQPGDGFCRPDADRRAAVRRGRKRLSVGGAMSRFALAAFLQRAREMKDRGR